MPAAKKAVGTRARRNVASTAAVLPARPVRRGRRPALPETPTDGPTWHTQVIAWWQDLWSSPMTAEYHKSDVHQLYVLAELYQGFWTCDTRSGRMALAAEIRQQRAAFGLTPYDRRRLEWTIEVAETAKSSGRRRRNAETPPAAPTAGGDPRSILRVVAEA